MQMVSKQLHVHAGPRNSLQEQSHNLSQHAPRADPHPHRPLSATPLPQLLTNPQTSWDLAALHRINPQRGPRLPQAHRPRTFWALMMQQQQQQHPKGSQM